MTDTKRIKECKRKIIAAINEAKIPFAVSELILENMLAVVREIWQPKKPRRQTSKLRKPRKKNCRTRRKTNETGNAIRAARGNRDGSG